MTNAKTNVNVIEIEIARATARETRPTSVLRTGGASHNSTLDAARLYGHY
jgi:hypothetical protein